MDRRGEQVGGGGGRTEKRDMSMRGRGAAEEKVLVGEQESVLGGAWLSQSTRFLTTLPLTTGLTTVIQKHFYEHKKSRIPLYPIPVLGIDPDRVKGWGLIRICSLL